MPRVEGSLMQAIHDYHFGNRRPAEKVAILVLGDQALTPQLLAQSIMKMEDLERLHFPTDAEVHSLIPIALQAQRNRNYWIDPYLRTNGRSVPLTFSRVEYFIKQVKLAYLDGPANRLPSLEEIKQGLRMLVQGRILEFCAMLVPPTKNLAQERQQKVLILASRLQIPIWLIEHEWDGNTFPTHMSLRVLVNARRLRIFGHNAFVGTTLHDDLQAMNIRRVVFMGSQSRFYKGTMAIGNTHWGCTSQRPNATSLKYKVMTSRQVLDEASWNDWVEDWTIELYGRL